MNTLLTKKRLPLLIALICVIELLIYLWADWTATLDKSTFFGIEAKFIFAKAARNAGRVSAAIFLPTLLMVGYYGLREIYQDQKKRDAFFSGTMPRFLSRIFIVSVIDFVFSKGFVISCAY